MPFFGSVRRSLSGHSSEQLIKRQYRHARKAFRSHCLRLAHEFPRESVPVAARFTLSHASYSESRALGRIMRRFLKKPIPPEELATHPELCHLHPLWLKHMMPSILGAICLRPESLLADIAMRMVPTWVGESDSRNTAWLLPDLDSRLSKGLLALSSEHSDFISVRRRVFERQ